MHAASALQSCAFDSHSSMSTQNVPGLTLPAAAGVLYPRLQLHVKLPAVLLHAALVWQLLSVSVVHSFKSEHVPKLELPHPLR
jgi:hypothetical protein